MIPGATSLNSANLHSIKNQNRPKKMATTPGAEVVKLHVYDLSRGMARMVSQQLLGTYIEGIWYDSVLHKPRKIENIDFLRSAAYNFVPGILELWYMEGSISGEEIYSKIAQYDREKFNFSFVISQNFFFLSYRAKHLTAFPPKLKRILKYMQIRNITVSEAPRGEKSICPFLDTQFFVFFPFAQPRGDIFTQGSFR
jgi:hypothetical protein